MPVNECYCRFRNTLRALGECEDHIEDENLSEAEERARKDLIDLCAKIGYQFGGGY